MRARTDRRIAGLYAVTPDTADTASLLARTQRAIAGGAAMVQYRGKSQSVALRREQASALVALCRPAGVALIVNDDAALAREIGADGVHVGADDVPVAEARRLLGERALVGASCYDDLDRAAEAVAAGADYVAFGSFFPSPTKPHAVRAGLDLVARAKARWPVPVVAIGGIDAGNVDQLVAAGVDAVAVISAVFDADDVEAAARAIASRFPVRGGSRA
jgi:thiamine-phosphate pyrophosphorylase